MAKMDSKLFEREIRHIVKEHKAKQYNRGKEIDDVLSGKKNITEIPTERKVFISKATQDCVDRLYQYNSFKPKFSDGDTSNFRQKMLRNRAK